MKYLTKEQFANRSPFIPLVFFIVLSSIMYKLLGEPILVLIVPFGLAYFVWLKYGWKHPVQPTKSFLTIFIGMYMTQFLHLIEEWNTGFYDAFPALWGELYYGQPELFTWDMHVFITGNLIMDFFWAFCLLLFPMKNAWANYNLYGFLAGMMVNVVGHPLYSIYLNSNKDLQLFLANSFDLEYHWYFPGLFTSFIHAIFCYLMIKELRRQQKATRILE